MKKKIAIIKGDGIGPEIIVQAQQVLDAVSKRFGHQFDYVDCLMGACAIDIVGKALPIETLVGCMESDAILLGAIGHPKYDNNPLATVRPEQGLLELRRALNLYTNIRPVHVFPSLSHLSPLKEHKLKNVDFVIFRELAGGIYYGQKECNQQRTQATDTCTYTRSEIEGIAKHAFEYAGRRRNKLLLVDKANVLETSRLWRHTVQRLAQQYEFVEVAYMFADNAAMQIIQNPQQFDVILTENMFGDILSDEASVLCGSLGLLPSASLGNDNALFEPIHGSYHTAAGKDIANPIGAILSVAMMLDYLGMETEAETVRSAVAWSINEGLVTSDLNSQRNYTTSYVGGAIAKQILEGDKSTAINNLMLGQSTIV